MKTQETELGHLVQPDAGPHPGIVMIHDVWGLSDHTRDLAGRLAGEGFAVLAVDLYRREAKLEITNPGAWIRDLPDAQVLADLRAAADRLGGNAGVTGFCMGGMYALLAACGGGFAAAAPFYGMLSYRRGLLEGKQGRDPLAAASELDCPLLAFFGEEDTFIPLEEVEQLKRELPDAAEVVVYPGAGHAFMNDTRPEAYRPEVAANAWRRMVDFFRRQLRAG